MWYEIQILQAGSMLLAGLFIYDVFWVFATDVMTTVAKGIEAPVLLQFPQDIYRVGWINASKHAMLGKFSQENFVQQSVVRGFIVFVIDVLVNHP